MKRLVLLGGGHAQVQVVEAFGAKPPPGTSIVLINRSRLTPYSGMMPGLIAGHYSHAECHIDLGGLCARARIELIEQQAIALDVERQHVVCADAAQYPYDLLSIDTGSTPPLEQVPGAQSHAIPVKPIEGFLNAAETLVEAMDAPGEHSIAVVGGGAAAFEVLLALEYRIRRRMGGRPMPALHLLTDKPNILPEFPERLKRIAERLLAWRRIRLHTNARAARVDKAGIGLASGAHIDAEHVIFVTGAQASAMFAESGLRIDEGGFVAVNAGLQSLSHPNVFASGDVASVLEHPRPKAGVFAVRQGPPLTQNLRRALNGEAPLPFVPQQRYLVILSAGGKYAIATRGGWTIEGEWVWRWKDWIDRRFVARFQTSTG